MRLVLSLSCLAALAQLCAATVFDRRDDEKKCKKTSVAILGAGVAGITTAQALHNQSISDFIIIEHNDYIGGRMAHTTFGKKPNGEPYVVELGANWVQGLGTKDGPENPVWSFAKKYHVKNTFSNYSAIATYTDEGHDDYAHLMNKFNKHYSTLEQNAGVILRRNWQDTTTRSGLSLAGWKPQQDMKMQAVEWWMWDWETAQTPEQSSFVFGITGYNLTFYQFNEKNNFVIDQRGFNSWLEGEAYTFLDKNDPRLMLSTTVKRVEYDASGVTVHMEDGGCISAAYAVCTFSLGVLQNDVVNFVPDLPQWKQNSIEMFQMGTYTKIFMQFNETFWPEDVQFMLYADPIVRGYYPVWQSLSTPGFMPGSNIIFVTVTSDQSYRVERQPHEKTKAEMMEVLRKMFPHKDIPEPTDFMFPSWTTTPWAYGSYSNWPPATTLEMHQNLRANVQRLWFAGEALSAEYFGFLHGAWFEGQNAGERIAGLLKETKCENKGRKGTCGLERHYEVLHGTTHPDEYEAYNGWPVSSFYAYWEDGNNHDEDAKAEKKRWAKRSMFALDES